jgi:hypothetical protein
MTALLTTCTKEKQCAVIQLSWAELVGVQQLTEDYQRSTDSILLQ